MWSEKKMEEITTCVTSGRPHISFNKKVREAETWQGPQSRSETGIISTSPPAYFSPRNCSQFNNATLQPASFNSSQFQGEKVFIWNNHAHFSPPSRTSSFMLMFLKGRTWMDELFSLSLFFSLAHNIQSVLKLQPFGSGCSALILWACLPNLLLIFLPGNKII